MSQNLPSVAPTAFERIVAQSSPCYEVSEMVALLEGILLEGTLQEDTLQEGTLLEGTLREGTLLGGTLQTIKMDLS